MFRYLGISDGVTWKVAPSIRTFGEQIMELRGTTKSYPTDGTLGDAAHSNRVSDHNPDEDGVVRAIDIHEVVAGQVDEVAEALRVSRDLRLKYFIHDDRMFSSYASGGIPAWTWRPYTGVNGHETHGHLSVVSGSIANSTAPWQIGASMALEHHPPKDYNELVAHHKIGEKPSWFSVWASFLADKMTTVVDSWAYPVIRLDLAYFNEKRIRPLEGRIAELEADVGALLAANQSQATTIARLTERVGQLEVSGGGGGGALPSGTELRLAGTYEVV